MPRLSTSRTSAWRLAGRFGPEVAAWCAGLSALADDIARRRGLRLGPAWPNGGTSVVLPSESGEGEPMVLKLTPDPKTSGGTKRG